MGARRTEPPVRTHVPGEVTLPSGRTGLMTYSGLIIGLTHVPRPKLRQHCESADRVQSLLLWGRPLAHTQMLVTALCTQERRP